MTNAPYFFENPVTKYCCTIRARQCITLETVLMYGWSMYPGTRRILEVSRAQRRLVHATYVRFRGLRVHCVPRKGFTTANCQRTSKSSALCALGPKGRPG